MTTYPISGFHEDFSGGVLDTTKWQVWGGTPTISSGRLALNTSAYASIATLDSLAYDLRESAIFVEMETTDPGAMAFLDLEPAPGSGSGYQYFGYDGGGVTGALVTWNSGAVNTPYDPVAHRWLRVRETTGTVYYETSPDGSTWTIQGSEGTWDFMANIQISLYTQDGTSGNVYFDNVNITNVTLSAVSASAVATAPVPTVASVVSFLDAELHIAQPYAAYLADAQAYTVDLALE